MHAFLLFIHIIGGGTALIAGAGALAMPKGGRLHRKAGTLFFAAMAVMTATGSLLAAVRPERITAAIGLLTFYLVATSWAAARRRDGTAGTFELVGFILAAGLAATFLGMGLAGASSPTGRLDSLPAAVAYNFGLVAALAACLDLSYILRRRLSQPQRIARHLWRMCTALLIATSSFFRGQQDKLPEVVQALGLNYVPILAVLAAMIFWIFKVRLGRSYGRLAPRTEPDAGPFEAGLPSTAET